MVSIQKLKRLKILSRKQILLVLLLLAVVCALVLVKLQGTNVTEQAPGPTITYSTDTPSETKPDTDSYDWQGAPSEPKYIELPSISASGFIQKVGVDQHRQIAVPNNIHVAGWYDQSVAPGSKGLSIIDGHVDGLRSAGIFKNLQKLRAGDTITVTLGNDRQLRYQVLALVSLPESDAAKSLYSQAPDVMSQLNLVTCGGSYDRQSKKYPDRIVVSAVLR